MEFFLTIYKEWGPEGGSTTILGLFEKFEMARQRAYDYFYTNVHKAIYHNDKVDEYIETNYSYDICHRGEMSGEGCEVIHLWLDEEVEI